MIKLNKKRDIVFTLLCTIATIVIFLLPTKFDQAGQNNSQQVTAQIIETNNEHLQTIGLMRTGEQLLKIKIISGKFKGEICESVNLFMGKLEFDKMYKKGDKVFTVLEVKENKIRYANVIDFYRLNYELILFVIFILLLVIFSHWTGIKALISFFFTAAVIWKILLPCFLSGYNPILITLLITSIFTFIIIFLVGGFSLKGTIAFFGSIAGVLLTCVISIVFGNLFHLHGAIRPFAETLIYNGFENLNISQIFLSGIFLSSSGAIMDISMDVSASMNEVVIKKPEISVIELIKSGFSVGKAVVGTMTTTLLLAYSGGYTMLLMVFIAQGTPLLNILNLQYVSAEILNTIVGSFGLIAVAPLTAIIGGCIYKKYQGI